MTTAASARPLFWSDGPMGVRHRAQIAPRVGDEAIIIMGAPHRPWLVLTFGERKMDG
ncbi:MAG: hypothetical protein AAAB35_24515 [Phyllobacterium sp.]|uniref:hypothetical protein n=1 Tax=Phyllobacterium sp. TaxID=1871046 RepID=UPI0030F07982